MAPRVDPRTATKRPANEHEEDQDSGAARGPWSGCMIAACVAVSSLGGKQEKDPPFDLVPAESSSDDGMLLPPVRCGVKAQKCLPGIFAAGRAGDVSSSVS